MRLIFCVEDDTDELAIARLIERIGGVGVDRAPLRFPRGGWHKAAQLAHPILMRAIQERLDGAVLAVDNDGSHPDHDSTHVAVAGCRYCHIASAARVSHVRAIAAAAGARLGIVITVPVQAIESWLLAARPDTTPAMLALGATPHERRRLKQLVYGTETPGRADMIETAAKIISNMDVPAVSTKSRSFAAFVTDVRAELLT